MNCKSIRYGATGTVQIYEVPVTGDYSIEAVGAQQAAACSRSKGLFHLVQGDVLKIVVGRSQQTNARSASIGAGHGGCSFVWKCATNPDRSDSIMLVATSRGQIGPARPDRTSIPGLPNIDGYVQIAAVTTTPPFATTGRPAPEPPAGLAYSPPGTQVCTQSTGGQQSLA